MLISTDPWVGTDNFTRANVIAHEYTLHEWYPVANTTARAQLVTDLGTAGITISASNPVRVYRADATTGHEHEVSEDGTNWRAVPSYADVPSIMAWTTATSSYTTSTLVNCGTTLLADSDQTTTGASFASASGVVVTLADDGLYVVTCGGEMDTTESSGRFFVQATASRDPSYGQLRVNLIPENQGVASLPMRLTAGDTFTAQCFGTVGSKTMRCSIVLARIGEK